MRNPKFKTIKPNYRKNILEISLEERGKITKYNLPFAALRENNISAKNKFLKIETDAETGHQGAYFVLEDGSKGDFPSDYVLYHCDPTFDWSPLNQIKRTLKENLKTSKLSLRTVADALNTSPAQVMRLLEQNKGSKQLTQLFQLAELAGYQIHLQLKKKRAA